MQPLTYAQELRASTARLKQAAAECAAAGKPDEGCPVPMARAWDDLLEKLDDLYRQDPRTRASMSAELRVPEILLECLVSCWGFQLQLRDQTATASLMQAAAMACSVHDRDNSRLQLQLVQQFMKARGFLQVLPTALSCTAQQLGTPDFAHMPADLRRQCLISASSLLMLSTAVTGAWPGAAGILASKDHQGVAPAAAELAAALAKAVATVVNEAAQAGEAEQDELRFEQISAIQEVVRAVDLLVQQLYSRLLQYPATSRTDNQLLDSKAFLHLLLLLSDMQLQPGAADALVPADALAVAVADSKQLQQFHKQVLQSFGDMPQQLWQQGQRITTYSQAAHTLRVLAPQLERQYGMDSAAPHASAVLSLLPDLIHVLFDILAVTYRSGEIDVAESSAAAAYYAAMCWNTSTHLASGAPAMSTSNLQERTHQRVVQVLQALATVLQQVEHHAAEDDIGACISYDSHNTQEGRLAEATARIFDNLLYIPEQALALAGQCCDASGNRQRNLSLSRKLSCDILEVAEHIIRLASTVSPHMMVLNSLDSLHNAVDFAVPTQLGMFSFGSQSGPAAEGQGSTGSTDSSSSSDEARAAHLATRRCFALLLSYQKLLGAFGEPDSTTFDDFAGPDDTIFDGGTVCGEAIKYFNCFFRQGLPAVMPWLLLFTRHIRLFAHATLYVVRRWQRRAAQAANQAGIEYDVSIIGRELSIVAQTLKGFQQLLQLLQPLQQEQHVRPLPQPVAVAAYTAVTPAVGAALQLQIADLVRQWEQQQLQPAVSGAFEVFAHWKLVLNGIVISNNSSRSERFHELSQEMKRSMTADALAAVTAIETAGSDIEAAGVVASHEQYGLQLQQQMVQACNQLCALLPLPLCCNNPDCDSVNQPSELQLVGGKSCVCSRCEVARYCGRACQAKHWQWHKRVCKHIREAKALATAAAAAGPHVAS